MVMYFPSPCECESVEDMLGFWFVCAFWGFLFDVVIGFRVFSYFCF